MYKRKINLLVAFTIAIFMTLGVAFSAYIIQDNEKNINFETNVTPNNIEINLNEFNTIKSANIINEKVAINEQGLIINDKFSFSLIFNYDYYLDLNSDSKQIDRAALEVDIDFSNSVALFNFISTKVKSNFIYLAYGEYELRLNPIAMYQYGYNNQLAGNCLTFENNIVKFVVPINENTAFNNKDFYIVKIAEVESNGITNSLNSWNFDIILNFDVLNTTYEYNNYIIPSFSKSEFENIEINVKGIIL